MAQRCGVIWLERERWPERVIASGRRPNGRRLRPGLLRTACVQALPLSHLASISERCGPRWSADWRSVEQGGLFARSDVDGWRHGRQGADVSAPASWSEREARAFLLKVRGLVVVGLDAGARETVAAM